MTAYDAYNILLEAYSNGEAYGYKTYRNGYVFMLYFIGSIESGKPNIIGEYLVDSDTGQIFDFNSWAHVGDSEVGSFIKF